MDIMIAMTPPPGPGQLRRDLTPCLVYPQILERGGGLTRAVTERASLFAGHYEQVIIFTTSFAPRLERTLAELRQRGALDERVVVRNFFTDSRWARELGEPPETALTTYAADGMVSERQQLPDGRFLRIVDRRAGHTHPRGYRYFDPDGRLIVTSRTARGHRHEVSATLHGLVPRKVDWGRFLAKWVDDELEPLPRPVLFSLQRRFSDPVLLASRRAAWKVASVHNCHYEDSEDPAQGIRWNFHRLLDNPRAVDEIVCLTAQQRRELEHDVPEAVVRSIPYPGRPPREAPGDKDLSLVVVVGQLVDRKRIDHAIRAFAQVVEAVPQARLEIYGEGVERRALKGLIKRLRLQKSVQLMGYSHSVNRAQARAACTLLTSMFEGYGRVIGESMSLGTPVIAYDIRYGPRDLIRDGVDGVLVTEHSPEALAGAIIRLLSDPQRALEMGVRASELIERFPVENFEQAWLDVVDRASSERTGTRSTIGRLNVRRVVQRRLRRAISPQMRRAVALRLRRVLGARG